MSSLQPAESRPASAAVHVPQSLIFSVFRTLLSDIPGELTADWNLGCCDVVSRAHTSHVLWGRLEFPLESRREPLAQATLPGPNQGSEKLRMLDALPAPQYLVHNSYLSAHERSKIREPSLFCRHGLATVSLLEEALEALEHASIHFHPSYHLDALWQGSICERIGGCRHLFQTSLISSGTCENAGATV